MQARKWHLLPAACAVALFSLAGCGGGGTSAAGSGGSSRLGVYVTDTFKDDFSQVWVTLYKIELSADGSTFTTVYDNAAGETLNISQLANTAQFLNSIDVPAGTYTSARVTFADHITLVPKAGGASINAPVDDRLGASVNGKVSTVIPATTTAAPGQTANLVIDFDLASFELSGGKVKPHLKRADDNEFHQKGKHAELEGTVSNLVSGTSFTLAAEHGRTLTVLINGDTSIFSSHAGTAATLANGQRVEVKGAVDEATQTVTATSVKIDDSNGGNGNHGGDDNGNHNGGDDGIVGSEAEGRVTSVDTAAKSFVVTIDEVEHFHPTGGTVIVKTTSTTVFDRRHSGGAAFTDVAAGVKVEAIGTYDAATNTLTAVRVEIK